MDIAGIIRTGIGPEPALSRAELERKCQEAYRAAVAAEQDRFREGMEAPGIAGYGDRMAAVLDLLAAHPDMSGKAAAEFVCLHMSSVSRFDGHDSYEAMRLAQAPRSVPTGAGPWSRVVADVNARRGHDGSTSEATDGAAEPDAAPRGGKWDRFVH